MGDSLTYEALNQRYQELQLRVTRFSSTEQELINTRDRLDHELELYKRLHRYNELATKAARLDGYYQVMTEALVDVFDLESAMILVVDLKDHQAKLYSESIHIEGREDLVQQDLKHLSQMFPSGVTQHLKLESFGGLAALNVCFEGLFYHQILPEFQTEVFLVGAVSIAKAPLYNQILDRHHTIFKVFVQQFLAGLSTRIRGEEVERQLEQIKASQAELRKLSLIATKTKNGVIISDAYGRVEWVNEAFTKISGFSLDEIKGKKPKEFLQGEDTSDFDRNVLKNALWNKEDVELTLVNYNKAGLPYYNQLEIISVFDEEGNHTNFIALQKDITSEIQTQQEMMRMNSRFEMITEKSMIGIWELEWPDMKIDWSDLLWEIYGFDRSSKISRNDLWRSVLHPDDKEDVLDRLRQMINGEVNVVHDEYRIIRSNDQAERMVECLTIAERDERGALIRLVGSVKDVTDVKQSQNSILKQNEELKKINLELDNFVYSISHDLRSPLLSIKGILSLLMHDNQLTEDGKRFLSMADVSIGRLDGTIQEILEYSRNSRLNLKPELFNLEEMVQNVFDDLKFSTTDPIALYIHVEGDVQVLLDKARVNVLLKNIIGNSVKYKRPDKDAEIKVHIDNQQSRVIVEISDNGEGISEEHLGRIFDMFFRGTSNSVGTGLGLYICKEIVNKMNGTIEAQSKKNEGTKMIISLPQ
jgi:PAS domain S-box-containing protein